jgi:signal transduction histidine kinase
LALRAAQIREEARTLAEQLADANRRLYEAQNEILRSRALTTVGEMAAGAAHEMNNPLAVISGRSQLLAQQLTDPRQKAAAQQVFEQSHRLSGIITEMMTFAKPDPPRASESELALLIEAALARAKTQNNPADREFVVTVAGVPAMPAVSAAPATGAAAHDAKQAAKNLKVGPGGDPALPRLPKVAVDPAQVTAALTEVLANAIQATEPGLPGGVAPGRKGRVTVQAGYDPYSRKVVVSIADDGCGMDERSLKRAFDPFFSNKPAGRRRGLGLAKALRWIEASGGSIRLESRPGEGTRVVILLPAVAGGQDYAGGADARRIAQSG